MKRISVFMFLFIAMFGLSGCVTEYTVSFSGVDSLNDITVNEGDLINEPVINLLEGEEFNGWYLDDAFSNPFDFSNPITSDLTLYADITLTSYDVIFIIDGEEYDSQSITHGDLVTIPNLLLIEWYLDETFINAYDFDSSITSGITLYAKITITFYDIDFMIDGEEYDSQSITYGDIVIFPTPPIKEGYNFIGWYLDLEYIELFNPENGITENALVYGKWEIEEISGEYKIALITDSGSIEDNSFNQISWEGIVKYALEYDITYNYYTPTEVSDMAYLDAIALAVENGAEIIVLPGWLFESSVYTAQYLYPNVSFVLIDGTPHDPTWTNWDTADNTASVLFNEGEAGFLAGYSAVIEGYTQLGFTGGMAVPAVVEYGVGFIAGAYYAAEEMGITITFGDDNYIYFNSFSPNHENQITALDMYNSGTEIIFSASGGAISSVIAAAIESGSMVIGIDVDQSAYSDVVLTSAVKNIDNIVYLHLFNHFNSTFVGGNTVTYGISYEAVSLPMDTSRFTTFTQAQYYAIYAQIVDGTIVVPTDYASLVTFLGDITGYPSQETVLGG